MKSSPILTAGCVLFLFAGSAHALSVNVIENLGTPGGGVVTIEILGEGDLSAAGGYALQLNWLPVGVGGPATATTTAGPDPNAQFGQAPACSQGAQNCIGANGGAFGTFLVSDSISTFTFAGFPPWTIVDWTTNSSGLSAASSLPSGQFTTVPEPGVASLLTIGLVGLGLRRRCR
jgi:hypothetical protein